MLKLLYKYTLPDFIIIGVNKGGTSFLYYELTLHPNVCRCTKKEVHFFDDNYHKGIAWYRAHFPIPLLKYYQKKARHNIVIGEATPKYICDPNIPERVFRFLPHVKLLVLLRNPVDRAYSHYNHVRQKYAAQETRSFGEAIEGDFKWLEKANYEDLKDIKCKSWKSELYSYVARGIYVRQLKWWFDYFPRQQFFIVQSENLFKNPFLYWEKIINFLGLPVWYPKTFQPINQLPYEREMDLFTRKRLSDFYRPYNKELCEFLNTDFDWC